MKKNVFSEEFFARMEEAGLDDEELELEVELSKEPEHLLRWLPPSMTVREGSPTPIGVTDRPAPRNVAAEIASEAVSSSCSFQPQQSEAARSIDDVPLIVIQASGSGLVGQEDICRDPQPSVSGQSAPIPMVEDLYSNPQPSRSVGDIQPPNRSNALQCDSEFDDEYDEYILFEPNFSRDIPDDIDFDEILRNRISALESNMDEAHDVYLA